MTTKRTFTVAMVGLPETECRVLKSIARISSMRTRSYEFVDLDSKANIDILIVDGDNPQAMQTLRGLPGQRPVLFFGSAEVADQKYLKRPIMGARVLTLLDEITVTRLNFVPEVDAGKGKAPGPEVVMPDIPKSGRLALVVDDSPTVRKHIELGLAPFGLSVHFAETGEEALQRLATSTYDIVFLDVVLPGIDGYSVCKTIKKNRDIKATPVIMLTGKSSTFDRIKGSLAGCDTYLTKPVEYELFQDVVKKHLGAIGAGAQHGAVWQAAA